MHDIPEQTHNDISPSPTHDIPEQMHDNIPLSPACDISEQTHVNIPSSPAHADYNVPTYPLIDLDLEELTQLSSSFAKHA